ncbi:lmo0937 family membrane protein [Flavobacterium pedocola]
MLGFFQYLDITQYNLTINIMKIFYNSIAILLMILWGISFFMGNMSSLIHLLLVPMAVILVFDCIGIFRLLHKT